MKEILFLIMLLNSLLLAYEDSDLDGVDDKVDRCPNTPFSELVDINGCTTKKLFADEYYDIIVGASYSESDSKTLNKTDTFSTTLQADYYYNKYSLGISTSYFIVDAKGYETKGLNDTYINASYQFKPQEELIVRVSAGVIIPTYSSDLHNNNMDYAIYSNLSYSLDKTTLFGGISYTLIMDDDIKINDANKTLDVKYQNSLALNMGAGYYFTNDLYSSVSYNTSSSIYKSDEDIKTLSFYTYYSIDKHLFCTFSYSKGISDSASKNYFAVRIGYYF